VSDDKTASTAVVEAPRSEARTTSPPAGGTDDTTLAGGTEDVGIDGGTDDVTLAGGTDDVTLAGGTDDEIGEEGVGADRARTGGAEGVDEGVTRRGDDEGGADAELISDRAGGAVGGGRGAAEYAVFEGMARRRLVIRIRSILPCVLDCALAIASSSDAVRGA
jgi:hypothetical protein